MSWFKRYKKHCCCTDGHAIMDTNNIENKHIFLEGINHERAVRKLRMLTPVVPPMQTEGICLMCRARVCKTEELEGHTYHLVLSLMREIGNLRGELLKKDNEICDLSKKKTKGTKR